MVSTDARSAVRSTFRPVPLAYGPELKAIRGLRSLGPAKRDLPANEHMGSVTELMHPTGYGGSMHLYDVERGNMGANAVVGGGLRATVGAALAFKLRGQARVAVAFFGDGATNTGAFHESLNLAQLWQVPVVFVCENNRWSESTPQSQHRPIQDLTQRAAAFGMRALHVDGEDVEAFHLAALNALQHALAGTDPEPSDVLKYVYAEDDETATDVSDAPNVSNRGRRGEAQGMERVAIVVRLKEGSGPRAAELIAGVRRSISPRRASFATASISPPARSCSCSWARSANSVPTTRSARS